MVNKNWGRLLSLAMAATLTVTSVPLFAHAEEASGEDIANKYAGEGYTLKWNDEFSGDSLDTSVWNVEQHEPGWVNAEKQRYTDLGAGNIEVSDGALHIISKYDNSGDEEVFVEDTEDAEAELQDFELPFTVGSDKAESDTIALQVNFGKIAFDADADAGSAKASVVLSDFSLKDVTEGAESGELLRDTGLENGNGADWSLNIQGSAKGESSFENGKVKLKIEESGDDNWHIQLQQNGLTLIPGHSYVFTMKATADVNRATEISFLDPANGYDWYAGGKLLINGVGEIGGGASSENQSGKVTELPFTVGSDKAESNTIALQVNFGKIAFDQDEAAGTAKASVVLSDFSLKDVTEGSESGELLRDTSLENGNGADWSLNIQGTAQGEGSFENGKVKLRIDESGDDNWHIQLQQNGLTLIPGHSYVFSMKASSDVNRATEISFLDPDNGYDWYAGGKFLLTAGEAGSGSTVVKQNGAVTSGRITTQNKMDFTYGRFEARARVPEGKGLLPAFWLMATDEGLYGQWPKCGEIDIMEVMGQNTSKSYHTIHYGYSNDTHKENQGTKVIGENGFSDDYHVFRADWEPGKITWYVDDEEVYTTSSWYTGSDDDNRKTYPAPFDQDFYVILNLAVGGSWVGYPDDYNNIDGKTFDIDYVRVYQKDDYTEAENSAVAPVEETVSFREPVGDNYLVNSAFEAGVDADENNNSKSNWVLHLESDAKDSTATAADGAVTINPSAKGDKTYSVQLKQAGIPMYHGWEYELSFDAVAEEERDIVVDVSAPDRNWSRYLQDTTTRITTEKQTYTYTFTVNEKNDPNGSLEINLGNLGSTAPVTISNIKLVHKSGDEIAEDDSKIIRPDGNYVYNGSFDEGEKRLGYWEVEEDDKDQVSVTNIKNKRELLVKVEVPEGASEANPVTISQSELAPLVQGEYDFSFSAYTDGGAADGLTAKVANDEFTPALTAEKTSFSKVITLDKDLTREESNVEFTFTKPGTYFLDDVFLTEKSLLKNGSFNAGTAGYKVYVNDNAKANYVVDSMNGNDNTFAMTIEDTDVAGAGNDWYIQLNQDGIKLVEGKYYVVGFKAKASMDRKIKYSVQHNGEADNDWTEYCGNEVVEIGSEWKEFSKAFQMSKTDDARFNITMGSVDGVRITEKHDVYIDDITLVEITKDEYDKLMGNAEEEPAPEPTEDPTPAPEPSEEPAKTEEDKTKEESKEQTPAPVATPETKEEAKPETKVNKNGKADKGEVQVSKNSVVTVTGKKTASFKANPSSTKSNVTVPATAKVDGVKVKITKIAANAFAGNTYVKRVTLGKNIKSIGKGAFDGCTNLKKVTVKVGSLSKVDKEAFTGCTLDKNFKVVIYAANKKNYKKAVKLFKNAGLKDVTFVYKKS